MLTFAQFKQKLTEARAAVAAKFNGDRNPAPVTKGKPSQTQLRRFRRRFKTRARAACDSRRFRDRHAGRKLAAKTTRRKKAARRTATASRRRNRAR